MLLAVIIASTVFLYSRRDLDKMLPLWMMFFGSLLIVYELTFSSWQSEKSNRMFGMLFQFFSLRRLILTKALLFGGVGTSVGCVFCLCSSIYLLFMDVVIDVPLYLISILIAFLSNLLVSIIFSLITVLIDNVVLLNILTMILIMFYITVYYSMGIFTNRELIQYILITLAGILAFISFFLYVIRFISEEHITLKY